MKCFFKPKKPSNFFILEISVTSDINLPFSPICLFLKCAVCCKDIKSVRIFYNFSERAFDIIFRSAFNKDMGLQFCTNLLSLSFFSINLMIASI